MNGTERSEHLAYSVAYESIAMYAMVQGAGAAAPVVPPTTFSASSYKGFMPRSINMVSTVAGDITRSGAGVYTLKLSSGLPFVMEIDTNVAGTDGKQCQVQDYNPTTRVLSFSVLSNAGVAADLAATDFVRFTFTGTKSVPAY